MHKFISQSHNFIIVRQFVNSIQMHDNYQRCSKSNHNLSHKSKLAQIKTLENTTTYTGVKPRRLAAHGERNLINNGGKLDSWHLEAWWWRLMVIKVFDDEWRCKMEDDEGLGFGWFGWFGWIGMMEDDGGGRLWLQDDVSNSPNS